MGGSLVEQGGGLYQQASYVNGVPYSFQSSLPVLGGLGAGNVYPNRGGPNTSGGGGVNLALNINGQPITPEFVTDQAMAAQGSSYYRTKQSANMQVPGLMGASRCRGSPPCAAKWTEFSKRRGEPPRPSTRWLVVRR